MKQVLHDIQGSIVWRDIARRYFGKSASWLYHKIDGIDSNGGFKPEEVHELRMALYDLAARIRIVAHDLEDFEKGEKQ